MGVLGEQEEEHIRTSKNARELISATLLYRLERMVHHPPSPSFSLSHSSGSSLQS